MMGGFGYGMFGLGWLFMLAFWVLAIGGIVWLVVALVQNAQRSAAGGGLALRQTPLDVLKTRYAKGEISKEQFEEMRRDLGA